jgi:signal transduction histidine kinase
VRSRAESPLEGDATVAEVAELRNLLAEAQSTLRAIRNGEVDAVVVESPRGPQVYTLAGAEFDYRMLIESMNEGALILTRSALILYANAHFALMVERPLAQVMGCSLYDHLSAPDQATLGRLMRRPGRLVATAEVLLQRSRGATLSARISVRRLPKTTNAASIAMVVVSDLTESRKREDLLRSVTQALMRMQESERQQLAASLADNVTQMLCAILLRAQALADRLPEHQAGVRGEALELAERLGRTVDEVRGISAGLQPQGLQILGLASELRGIAAEFAGRLDVPIHLTVPKSTSRLSGNAELTLCRALQEALRNVEQHARPRNVWVTLKRRGLRVRLTIKDDGVGFDVCDDPAQALHAGHFGLLLLRERATSVGGSLTVRSAVSVGTQVCLSVPVSQEPSASG